ncbi:hypothetical protein [Amnibacterium sp.]|uniref:hypothetical protein n=1 Tax=Amnibacterium sp. TaxID=1872496 RepID=UPI00262B0821|nr:hypothetical protein [Amnibacterium sp.]
MKLTDGLPPSLAGIAELLSDAAKSYDNRLKWNEQAMFKADLRNLCERWRQVDPSAFWSKCLREGMRPDDVNELIGWLGRAQAGRRLVPHRAYRHTGTVCQARKSSNSPCREQQRSRQASTGDARAASVAASRRGL